MNIADAPHRKGWPGFSLYRPHPPAATLRRWLEEAHTLSRQLFRVAVESSDTGPRLEVPLLAIVNPPLWELGHVGWFHEFWVHRRGDFAAPSLVKGADKLYDSSRVEHDSRWHLDLPDLEATWRYLDTVHDRTRELLERDPIDDEASYFVQLGILHHDMHNEAFCYMWHTLGFNAPLPLMDIASDRACGGDVEIPAGELLLGARPGTGFVFDNEKWAREIEVPSFAIARCAVSNAEFLAFVEDGGYARREFWSEPGWQMRARLSLESPRYWRKQDGQWSMRRFNDSVSLPLSQPVLHVSWHEAQAYCRWAGRRLPTEAEWERAAATAPDGAFKRRFPWGDSFERAKECALLDARSAMPAPVSAFADGESAWGVRQMLGNAWEWTESRFAPYPGFSADPYKEYSEPWFVEDHRVLRGGSFATPLRLIRTTWRNFYKPDRADVFCGFRTCAIS